MPKGYKLNKPKLSEISSTESRNYVNSPDYCINWSEGKFNQIEVIQAKTGKTVSGNVSQLAKISFFQRYTNLMNILPYANELYHVAGGNYYETKCAARSYQVIFIFITMILIFVYILIIFFLSYFIWDGIRYE